METKIEYRLRKADAEDVFGPLSEEKLRELAETALIAPNDLVDRNDDQWKVAPEIEFLEMVWVVETGSGQFYGPTTLGTVREFYGQGEIKLTDRLIHAKNKEQQTVGKLLNIDLGRAEVLGAPEKDDRDSGGAASADAPAYKFDADTLKNLERAKDLRIRQLETDLEKARSEHEQLLHKFRKLTEDYIQIKKAIVS